MCKKNYYELFERYIKETGILIEPVVSKVEYCGEIKSIYCHPDDANCFSLDDFKHAYAII